MLLGLPTVLRATVSQDAQHWQLVTLEEREYPVFQQLSGRDRRLRRVQLGKSRLLVGIHKGLLVNRVHALQVPT